MIVKLIKQDKKSISSAANKLLGIEPEKKKSKRRRNASVEEILGTKGTDFDKRSRKIVNALRKRAKMYRQAKNPIKKYAKIRGIRDKKTRSEEPKPYFETHKAIRRMRTL